MAAILKHWREAATLIVLCRTTGVPNFVSQNRNPCKKLKTVFDYKILMLKRSGKSKFMPSAYVFPGGVASDADFDKEWLNLFSRSGIDLAKWPRSSSACVEDINSISPMLTRKRDDQFSHIPPEVAFRINAIRETFEESGLLLVRQSQSSMIEEGNSRMAEELPVSASLCGKLEEHVLSDWRKRVEKDASEFIKMCQQYDFLPDIWALYDWCNWLTPTRGSTPSQRRFDTAFYVTVLDVMPEFISHDSGETVHLEWLSPIEALKGYRSKLFWIAPPQLLEMAKFVQYSEVSEIAKFAVNRSKYFMDRWMPVMIQCKDKMIFLHNGDREYPVDPDWTGTREELTEDYLSGDLKSPINRSEVFGPFNQILKCDIKSSAKHISPLSEDELVYVDDWQLINQSNL